MSGNQLTAAAENYNAKNTKIKAIYDLLVKGDKEVKLSTGKDIILLLGNTGSGKSTLAQYLTGDLDNLESKEVEEGEFIILDNNNKISYNSTVISHTIFPELMVDPKTNTTYYDCPGFSDTRTAAHEIAATYFTKKVVDSARSVKLVFVLNHYSVRRGMDRKDFILLLKHATDFIKNIEKFKNSIALVVTKVENTYIGPTGKLLPDEKIVKAVANYLQQVKQDVNEQSSMAPFNSQNSTTQQKIPDILDAIMSKENQDHTRIGIFRRPNEPGNLSNIEIFQKGKISLENIISKNIQYTQVFNDDFGYTVSSDSKILVESIVEEIHKSINDKLCSLGDKIQEYYTTQEEKISESKKLETLFKTLYESFSEIQNDAIKDIITHQEYTQKINSNINNFQIGIPKEHIADMKKDEDYIKFLYLVSNRSPKNGGSSQLAAGLTKVIEYFNHSYRFYICVTDLHTRLSQYEVQNNRFKYITRDVRKLSDLYTSPLKDIIKDIFKDINDATVNQPQLNLLKRVLDLTLNHQVESICTTHDELVMKGYYVKLSDVVKQACYENVSYIKVYALHKVFIDSSLNLTGREVHMAIIAPTWEILGGQSIILDGKPGTEYRYDKAEDGSGYGNRGGNGLPGAPGGPAGTFIGIGRYYINDQFLQISANGGKGSNGQHGGDGSKGADGPECTWCPRDDNLLITLFYNKDDIVIPGQPGGDGGNGGVGGYGGLRGSINIVGVGNDQVPIRIKVKATDGVRGRDGRGGKGGSGGRYFIRKIRNYVGIVHMVNEEPMNRWRENGFDGRVGTNSLGIQKTWNLKTLLRPNGVKGDYIEYLRHNLGYIVEETVLRSFLNEIENNNELSALNNRKKRVARYPNNDEISMGELKQFDSSRGVRNYTSFSNSLYLQKHLPYNVEWSNDVNVKIKRYNKNKGIVSEHDTQYSNNPLRTKEQRSLDQNIENTNGDKRNYLFNEGMSPASPLDKNLLTMPVKSAMVNDFKSFSNLHPQYSLTNSHSNLLLWDLIFKKLTGRNFSPRRGKSNSYHKGVDFASNLAYSHYAPKSKK